MGPERATGSVLVGRVRRAHGVRGEVSVEVLSDVPGRFASGVRLAAATRTGERRVVDIESTRAHSGQLLVRFAGIGDRDEAERLRGASLEVSIDQVPPAEDGAYYYYELVGCQCVDGAAGDLGEIEEIVEDGGGLLLSVKADEGVLLIPFVEDYIREVDLEERTIELELPDGLLESCVSQS